VTESGQSDVPTKTAVVVDVNSSSTTVTPTASMSVGRRQHNLTVLADGSVLPTGVQSRSVDGLVDLDNRGAVGCIDLDVDGLVERQPGSPIPLQRQPAA
jgi:hypothetical protein